MLNFLKFPVIAILLLMSGFLRAEILIGNAGVPGNSTQEALNRLEADVIALNPTAVIILLGTNDALNPAKITSVERFGENLSAICRQLQAAGVQKVIFITPFPAVESILPGGARRKEVEDGMQMVASLLGSASEVSALRRAAIEMYE